MSKILFGPSYNNTQYRDEWIIRKLLQFLKGKLLDAGASERLYKKLLTFRLYITKFLFV